MNKRELVELLLTKEDQNKIDYAYPQQWADKMRELGVQPEWFVWSYINDAFSGAPLNLAEMFCSKYGELPDMTIEESNEKAAYVGAIYSAQQLIHKAMGL